MILGRMPTDQITPLMKQICFLQVKPLCELLEVGFCIFDSSSLADQKCGILFLKVETYLCKLFDDSCFLHTAE